jgi:hypothetical protein
MASAPAGIPRQPTYTLFIPYAQLIDDRRMFNQRSGACRSSVNSDEVEVSRMLQGVSWP